MSAQMESHALLRSYLLGRLSPGQKEAFEKHLFEDNDLIESLALAEEELIDAYLSKALSPRDAESFESIFLVHPAREDHVQLIEQLKQIGMRKPPQDGHSRRQFSAMFLRVAAVLIFLAISLAVFLYSTHDRPTMASKDGKGAAEKKSNAMIPHSVPQNNVLRSSNDAVVFPVHLDSPIYRGSGSKPPILVSSSSVIEFFVKVPNHGYSDYRVTLQTVERKLALQTTVPNTNQTSIRFTVPASELPDSDYIITVQGLAPTGELDSAGEYFVRIRLQD